MEVSKHPVVVRADRFLERYGKIVTAGSVLGLAMSLVSAAYIGLRGFLQSADPIGAVFLVLGLTFLLFGVLWQATGAVMSLLVKRASQKEWPVNLGCTISPIDGAIYLHVWNNSASEELKASVASALGPKIHATPYTLPWVHEAGEYRHIPRKMSEVVKLCDFEHGPISDQIIALSFPAVGAEAREYELGLSTFFTGLDDRAVGSIMLRVAVVGRQSGFKKDFRVLIEGRADLSPPRRLGLTVDIPESRPPGRLTKAVATLRYEDDTAA